MKKSIPLAGKFSDIVNNIAEWINKQKYGKELYWVTKGKRFGLFVECGEIKKVCCYAIHGTSEGMLIKVDAHYKKYVKGESCFDYANKEPEIVNLITCKHLDCNFKKGFNFAGRIYQQLQW